MLTLSTKQLGLITMTSLAALIIGTGATWAQVKNPELEALKQVVEELRRVTPRKRRDWRSSSVKLKRCDLSCRKRRSRQLLHWRSRKR